MGHRRSRCRKVDRNQSLILHIADSPFPAPTKPKLVARAAGSETSPWKVKKDAPKISAKDVPGVMRPLMSCALWCLHESIERNDANQLFLLSDQIETRAVAQKLNITVRSCTEVAITIASKDSKTSLDNFGDLEREFGVQLKSVLSNTRDAEEVNVEEVVIENANEEMLKNGDVMEKSMSSEGTASTDASSIVHEGDLEKKVSEPRIKTPSVNGDRDDGKIKEQGFMAETATSSIAENLQKKPAKSVESVKCPADGIMHQDSENHLVRLSESVNGLSLDGVKSQSDLANKPALGHSAVLSPLGTSLLQLHDVEPLSLIHQVQTISGTSKPPENTTAYSTSTSNSVQEPEDSDEEVVVFVPQPKRLSAQQKPAQQSSRPSTPKEQSQQKSSLKAPPKGKVKKPSPKPSTVDQAHSQPFCSPTVIDPDAFGRNYRVNLNTSPRSAHNHNGHCSHRIRGNMQSAQTGQIPRNSPRQLARTSPPRNVPQDRSQRLTPVPPRPLPKETPNHQRLASRTSPPRLPASKAEDVPSSDVGSRASAAVLFSKSQYSESRTGEPAEFVPQPAFSITQLESDGIKSGNEGPVGDMTKSAPPNAQLKANAPQPRVFEPSEFVRRPPRPVPEFKPRAPRHKAFEPAEFVPKDFSPKTAMPRTQLKTYPPEPESIEPRPSINDVDYVLKSGSSRASARGRGRLWTPS